MFIRTRRTSGSSGGGGDHRVGSADKESLRGSTHAIVAFSIVLIVKNQRRVLFALFAHFMDPPLPTVGIKRKELHDAEKELMDKEKECELLLLPYRARHVKARKDYEASLEYCHELTLRLARQFAGSCEQGSFHGNGPILRHIEKKLCEAKFRVASKQEARIMYELAFSTTDGPPSGILLYVGQPPLFLGVPEDVSPFAGLHTTSKAAHAILEATNCTVFTFRQLEVVMSILNQFQAHQLPALMFEVAMLRASAYIKENTVLHIHTLSDPAHPSQLKMFNVPIPTDAPQDPSSEREETERKLARYKLEKQVCEKLFFPDVWPRNILESLHEKLPMQKTYLWH